MLNCGGFFDVDAKRIELSDLEKQTSEPDFWNDQEKAQKTLQQRARLERALATAEGQQRLVDDIAVLFEFAVEDDASANELRESIKRLTRCGRE